MQQFEIWKDILGYEGVYLVSNFGRIKRVIGSRATFINRILKGNEHNGYLRYTLSNNGTSKRLLGHVIVATAFIPNPNNLPEVNHIEGNKSDNRACKLEWVTNSDNQKHAYRTGLHITRNGDSINTCKLTESQVLKIRETYKSGEVGYDKLAKIYNVDRSNIYCIIKNKTWKHLNKTA